MKKVEITYATLLYGHSCLFVNNIRLKRKSCSSFTYIHLNCAPHCLASTLNHITIHRGKQIIAKATKHDLENYLSTSVPELRAVHFRHKPPFSTATYLTPLACRDRYCCGIHIHHHPNRTFVGRTLRIPQTDWQRPSFSQITCARLCTLAENSRGGSTLAFHRKRKSLVLSVDCTFYRKHCSFYRMAGFLEIPKSAVLSSNL